MNELPRNDETTIQKHFLREPRGYVSFECLMVFIKKGMTQLPCVQAEPTVCKTDLPFLDLGVTDETFDPAEYKSRASAKSKAEQRKSGADAIINGELPFLKEPLGWLRLDPKVVLCS
jgi:hypothetical protein